MENTQKNSLIDLVKCSWLGNFPGHFSFEIALSGGVDSIVLLDVMYQLSLHYPLELSAVHVHHGLQDKADEWVRFCTKVCQQYAIPLRVEKVEVNCESALGLEAEARRSRYQVFETSKEKVVVLAHHQNDQIETFLLAMLRGGGLRGMVAMPFTRVLSPTVTLWRPLLSVPKADIIEYAEKNLLKHVEDPSNRSFDHTRNWVRNALLPFMQHKIDFSERQLLQNISNLQDKLSIINELRLKDYQDCSQSDVIIIPYLLKLSVERASEVLLYFLERHKLGKPRAKSVHEFVSWLFSKSGQSYEWQVPYGKVYVCHQKIWAWQDDAELKQRLENNYFTSADISWQPSQKGIGKDFLAQNWSIRPVKKSDTINTEIGTQSVLNLLKRNKIPDFIRRRWPVIVDAYDQSVCVVGLRVDVRYQQKDVVVPVIKTLELYIKLGTKAYLVNPTEALGQEKL